MKVRRPGLSFDGTPARWAAIPEFAQQMNAASTWIPSLERFLNRVLAKAAKTLDESDPKTAALRDDIRMFIRQESTHYATHDAFNAILPRAGYDIHPFLDEFDAAFDRLFRTRSLAFLCAYCEGFETMGPPAALAWLDEMEDLLDGARPEVVRLWKWHLMEEYEHRTVCHDVFARVHGGYLMRVYGFWYQFIQLNGFSTKVLRHLHAVDRAGMSPTEQRRSRRAARRVARRLGLAMLPRLLRAMSPFYTPRRSPEPRMFQSFRATFDPAVA